MRDIIAEVTSRLYGSITHLIVSVDTTDALKAEDITLTWTPRASEAVNGAETNPTEIAQSPLHRKTHHLLPWPGGTLNVNNHANEWPGWRNVEKGDLNSNDEPLHPISSEVMSESEKEEMFRGNLILDATQATHPWRGESNVKLSVNPEAEFTVTYREEIPMSELPELNPEPDKGSKPDLEPVPNLDQKAAPDKVKEDPSREDSSIVQDQLTQTGNNLNVLPSPSVLGFCFSAL